VSIGAENEVSVQSDARFHELEKHASKEGTNFSKGLCWVHYGLPTSIVREQNHCTSFERFLQ